MCNDCRYSYVLGGISICVTMVLAIMQVGVLLRGP